MKLLLFVSINFSNRKNRIFPTQKLFFTVTRFPASVHIIDVDASAEKKVRRGGVYAKLRG